MNGGGVGADVHANILEFDLSGGQLEKSFGLQTGDRSQVLQQTGGVMGDQDEMPCFAFQPDMCAAAWSFRKVASSDKLTSPLPLDQSSQGGGEQKDTGGAHRVSAFRNG